MKSLRCSQAENVPCKCWVSRKIHGIHYPSAGTHSKSYQQAYLCVLGAVDPPRSRRKRKGGAPAPPPEAYVDYTLSSRRADLAGDGRPLTHGEGASSCGRSEMRAVTVRPPEGCEQPRVAHHDPFHPSTDAPHLALFCRLRVVERGVRREQAIRVDWNPHCSWSIRIEVPAE